ncbi:uncharacterized protein V6R79_014035 [Siganus canaliculatus]
MWKTTLQMLVLQLCSTSFGLGNEQRVVVTEGSDAVLPCSFKDTPLNYLLFDWKKDDQQEVFLYDAGIHYINGRGGQDPQFRGRVSHFEDELKHGNASIKIRNTKVEDSGNYSCFLPRFQSQPFHIELIVAAPEPHITILNVTEEGVRLQCHVSSASPKPTVKWQDGDGNILHTEEPEVSEVKGRFSVTLVTTVTSSGHFRCVVTQEEIQHQVYSETHVYFRGELNCSSDFTVMLSALIVSLVIVVVLMLICCLIMRRLKTAKDALYELKEYSYRKPEECFREIEMDSCRLHVQIM